MSNPFLPAAPPLPRSVKAVDLHMHSPVSDGFWTTATLPPAARALGIGVIALTDHDDVTGVPAMIAACRPYGITVIPGVEISTVFATVGYHMLAYGIDLGNAPLLDTFNQGRAYYNQMCHAAIDELARRGQPLDPAKSPQILGEGVKIYHLVAALIENGYVANMSQAYGFVNQAGAHYGWSLPMEEAIALVHGAGGVAVIAHPGRAEPGFTAASEAALDGMRAAGLDGIECFHPYHTPDNVTFYESYAQHHGLLISCGSDTHGPGSSPRMLTAWPAGDCRALLERCGIAVAEGDR
ncbi:MAG: PHP domain-containing protein [Chloroflexota bacterium]|nr:PHP domain-containing protein [Chloroflexota bacterium]